MAPYDDETERYLKEFRPRALRELEIATRVPDMLPRRVAAALAVALLTGGAFWFARRETTPRTDAADIRAAHGSVAGERQYYSSLTLTMIASTDNEKFESLLADESRQSLPSFRGEHSTLKVLAKE